jgi:hypothetical protein
VLMFMSFVLVFDFEYIYLDQNHNNRVRKSLSFIVCYHHFATSE